MLCIVCFTLSHFSRKLLARGDFLKEYSKLMELLSQSKNDLELKYFAFLRGLFDLIIAILFTIGMHTKVAPCQELYRMGPDRRAHSA